MSEHEDIVKKIIKVCDTLKSRRANADNTFQDISDYVLLNGGDFTKEDARGMRRDRKVFDSTAIQANEQLASVLHSGLTDPSSRWFNLKPKNEFFAEMREFKIWIEAVHKIMMSVFTSSKSGFSQQMHELFLSLVGYGTGVMWVVDEKDKGITFNSRHLGEVYIEENSKGFVDTVYRKFKFTARQAIQEWGMENVGDKIKDALQVDPSKEFNFIHCVMPRIDFDKQFPGMKLKNEKFEFVSVYINVEDKNILDLSGFHELPYLVPRWEKLVGEVYGRSPSWNSLSDILMVNIMSETVIKGAQKQIDPPLLMSDDGVMLPLQTFPGGVNIGGVNDEGRQLIQPLITGGRLDIGLEMMEQRRRAIKAAFFVDMFEQRQGVQPLTATESTHIEENKLRLIGPQVKRIEDEFLSLLIDRVFGILSRKGELPQLPDEILALGLNVVDLEIEFISPLAFTQRSNQLLSYNRFFANAGSFLQFQPEAMQNFDIDEIVRSAAEMSGVPISQIKSKDAVAQERQAQAQQIAQQQQLEQIQAGAETAATLQKSGISVVPEE